MNKKLTAPMLAVATALLAVIPVADAQSQQQAQQADNNTDIERIVAVVNDEIISEYDLNLRLALIIGSSGGVTSQQEYLDLRKQVLDSMIDEKLELQEVQSVGKEQKTDLMPTAKEIDDALTQIARNNRMSREDFDRYVESLGSDVKTLRPQVASNMAWQRLISGRYGSQTRVSDEEVETVMKHLMDNAGQSEYLVSEIFLSADTRQEREDDRELAARLSTQIRAGAPFESLARQFSKAASSANGGVLGWVQADQVSEPIAAALQTMDPGTVSDPIEADNGIYIIRLQDRRKILGVDPMDERLTLKQITATVSADATQDERQAFAAHMQQVSADRDACADTAAIAADIGNAASGDVGQVRLRDVPKNIGDQLKDLPIGQASAPFAVGNQLQMLIVCARTAPKVQPPSFEAIESQLVDQRLSLIAQRYLRDLRQDAIIDYR